MWPKRALPVLVSLSSLPLLLQPTLLRLPSLPHTLSIFSAEGRRFWSIDDSSLRWSRERKGRALLQPFCSLDFLVPVPSPAPRSRRSLLSFKASSIPSPSIQAANVNDIDSFVSRGTLRCTSPEVHPHRVFSPLSHPPPPSLTIFSFASVSIPPNSRELAAVSGSIPSVG